MSYFSERERGELPRDEQEIGVTFWNAFVALITTFVSGHYLAEKFPDNCFECPLPVGCNEEAIGSIFRAEIQGIWPLKLDDVPETGQVIDAVEFFARYISKPIKRRYHDYGRHDHLLSFDRELGYSEYFEDINRLFRRCRHPFELKHSGHVFRIVSPVLQQALSHPTYTSDAELNRLISAAIDKFRDPRPSVREESLEKLWDVWERLKTYYSQNKKQSVSTLLELAIPEPQFRARIEVEARELTDIGNSFMIRHTETGKTRIERQEHIDYLFHRLFALIWMLLQATKIGT